MKWLIASDIHGSAAYTKELLERFQKERADRLILLGDLLYHGPRNALPGEYDPKAVAAMLNEYRNEILSVRGKLRCRSGSDDVGFSDPGGLCALGAGRSDGLSDPWASL